jgi:hypothetical protein
VGQAKRPAALNLDPRAGVEQHLFLIKTKEEIAKLFKNLHAYPQGLTQLHIRSCGKEKS